MGETKKELRVGNGKGHYQVVSGYQDHEQLRKSFNGLTGKVFGFSLEDWYQNGFWTGRYIPYSLLDNDRIVANVSVNMMDYIVFSEKKRYIQIGTVMTDEDYRGQGLNRQLLEIILEEWEDHCDLFYLYANDSVVDYYPKFGFRKAKEFVYSRPFMKDRKKDVPLPRKLNMDDAEDREFLFDSISATIALSEVAMVDNPYLAMLHCMAGQRENLHYFEEQGVIAIASHEGDTLVLHDVYCSSFFAMEEILEALATEQTRRVRLGFAPQELSRWERVERVEEDSTFFVREGKGSFPEGIMFPVMSHA